jgi:hypothetical protein
MKNNILYISILSIYLSSCMETEKFNQEAYDEYIQRRSMNCAIDGGDENAIYIEMNKPNFEFYLENKKLDFTGLHSLDTFIKDNKELTENCRFFLVGRENVKAERIDSVVSILHKYNRSRFHLVYQKGFWEK